MASTAHLSRRARNPMRRVPTDADLAAIPVAQAGEFELTEHETNQTRRRLYSLNKDNVVWRYRTMREGSILLIWKVTR